MKWIVNGCLCLTLMLGASGAGADPAGEVGAVLDRFHSAAAEADGETYFSLIDERGVFIGTDAGEYWSKEAFHDYAMPYFNDGQGWTYTPRERSVTIGPGGATAWFHELLDNDKYGVARGTGVLVATEDGWRIAQYHLAFPIPNEISGEVTERIRNWRAAAVD